MNLEDFNFIGKRVVIEMDNGTQIAGYLQGADDNAFYLDEDAGAYVQHKIIYKRYISWIMQTQLKNQQMGSQEGVRVY
ncbi:MAG: RNA chaperone Hfq [Lachnospiraceae bacterium]|jgi:small nuclear ribonucleoprotein (snRNP)-like protein|nr:RNA chaperone Hfq [Lachnospiraceae bacterium]MCR4643667.1 RNA chaperone Hfq [Lachnospiraceae bacterium]